MRLIGDFKQEKEAYGFHQFLLKQKIQNSYDPFKDPITKETAYHIWILEEDDWNKAVDFYQEFLNNPQDDRFRFAKEDIKIEKPPLKEAWKINVEKPPLRRRVMLTVTHFMVLLCAFIYIWDNTVQWKTTQVKGPIYDELGLTSVKLKLMFDDPKYFHDLIQFLSDFNIKTAEQFDQVTGEAKAKLHEIENEPTWRGVDELIVKKDLKDWDDIPPGTLFKSIREGEVWRLFTPCILHGGLLHILFNMAWLLMLGAMMEPRVGKFKMLLFMIVVGIVSNIAQYLMSGPNFIGFSGIVVGMVGFIWIRQKMAPWEGYALAKPIITFMTIYVLGMIAISVIFFTLDYLSVSQGYGTIANTAHVVGGIMGILLGATPLFKRSVR
jgi:GlpG protein